MSYRVLRWGWMTINLQNCSALSLLLHGWVLVPWLANWLAPPQASNPTLPLPLQIRLVEVPRRLAGEPTRPQGAAPRAVLPTPSPHHSEPVAARRVVRSPRPGRPAALLPDYPTYSAPRRPQPRPTPSLTGGDAGTVPLDPPVLLKGPERIPVPPFLQNRDGHFLLTLRCRVDPEGGAQVEVMEGTGAPDLDESVRSSFSGLPWYRAEMAGRPVAVSVRLVIEGRWQAGEDSIDWGGRTPRPQF